MQIKTFMIPLMGNETVEEEVNRFLRSHRVLTVDRQFASEGGGYWTLLVTWQENGSPEAPAPRSRTAKKDYRELLGAEEFARFARYRDIRSEISKRDNVPAYAIFTNDELAEIAQLPELTIAGIRTVKGIDKRADKYGAELVAAMGASLQGGDDPFAPTDETPHPFDA